MNIRFEWDERKNAVNKMKHGVSFEEAAMVFFDPKPFEMLDWTHSLTEERWLIIGSAGWTLLTVIFTERDGIIRIISARKATKNEKEMYFYGYGTGYIN